MQQSSSFSAFTEYHKINSIFKRGEGNRFIEGDWACPEFGYLADSLWHWTEKVDGTNIRVIWQGGNVLNKLTFGGKTDNAQIHADLIKWLYEHVSADKLKEIFPEQDAVIYGEGYGAGIQKGGGDYTPEKKLIVFDVLVDGKWWLSWEDVCDVAGKLSLDVVPDFGEMTLEDATELVRKGFKSRCAINAGKDAEGLVGRPLEALFDKKGARLIVKLKTKDF